MGVQNIHTEGEELEVDSYACTKFVMGFIQYIQNTQHRYTHTDTDVI